MTLWSHSDDPVRKVYVYVRNHSVTAEVQARYGVRKSGTFLTTRLYIFCFSLAINYSKKVAGISIVLEFRGTIDMKEPVCA